MSAVRWMMGFVLWEATNMILRRTWIGIGLTRLAGGSPRFHPLNILFNLKSCCFAELFRGSSAPTLRNACPMCRR
jgi:hypothetical protein